jgi:hypothetical protein
MAKCFWVLGSVIPECALTTFYLCLEIQTTYKHSYIIGSNHFLYTEKCQSEGKQYHGVALLGLSHAFVFKIVFGAGGQYVSWFSFYVEQAHQ